MLVPPALTNGSGIPFVGSTTVTTPILRAAWAPMASTIPAASRRPNRSRHRITTAKPRKTKRINNAITPTRADQTQFLAYDREDEIRGVFGQMAVLAGALSEPLAPYSAGPDGHQRLVRLVRDGFAQPVRVKERFEPLEPMRRLEQSE